MIIKGKLIKCNRTKKTFKGHEGGSKLYITLAEAEITDEQMEELTKAFAESGKQFTPEWIKKFEGFANFATKFELPCETFNGKRCDSVEDEIADGLKWFSADVQLSINVKTGALYPQAVKFLSVGKDIDAFAEFDEDNADVEQIYDAD